MPDEQMPIVDRDGKPVTCSRGEERYRGECPLCKRAVIYHCKTGCKAQITGCSCTQATKRLRGN